jgi:NADPH:quinone reductase
MAILDVARIADGDVVLVTAAAGGLGSLLSQAARHAGATVVGAAGPSKLDRVGADVVVDYTQSKWSDNVRDRLDGREVTVVLDGVGGEAGRAAFELLARGGRHVLYGWSAGEMTPISSGDIVARSLTVSSALVRPGSMRELEERSLEAAATGRLVPLVTTFALADAAAAHAALEGRTTTGKVVLIP